MAHAWTYETAASYWSANRDNPEGAWDAFESAEEFLLDHEPLTTVEVLRVIDVLVEQGGDRRTDGRDVTALERVRRFLRTLSDDAAPGNGATTFAGTSKSGRRPRETDAEVSA